MTKTLIHAIVLNDYEYDESLTFDTVDGDYTTHALFDYEGDRCIYHEDNTHGNPEDFLDGLIAGVKLTGNSLEIVEALIFLDSGELDSNYIDVCTAIRRRIKENMN